MSYARRMNKNVTFCLLLAFLLEGDGRSAPPASEKLVESIQVKLNQIILPDFSPTEISLEEAIEYLRVKSREFDTTTTETSQKGVNFVIIGGSDEKLPASVGLRLNDVPLAEALRLITESAGMKFVVEPYAVAIRDKDDKRGPSKRPSTNTLRPKVEKIILPTVQFQDATIEEAVEHLRISRACLDADGHSSTTMALNYVLKLRPNDMRPKISLDLKDAPLSEALRYCAEIAGATLRYDRFAVVITDKDAAPAVPLVVNAPASSLILPQVALSGATLQEAVDFIWMKSRELDPAHQAISITIQPGAPSSTIDLDLRDIPASEALRYLAELSGHTLSWDGTQYSLTPAGEK
ncbi:MAG: hypothetical protein R3F13_12955 [Prosthecobacter sp.]